MKTALVVTPEIVQYAKSRGWHVYRRFGRFLLVDPRDDPYGSFDTEREAWNSLPARTARRYAVKIDNK